MLNVLSSCTTREGRWLKALFSTPPCRLCPPTVCVHVAREGSVGAKYLPASSSLCSPGYLTSGMFKEVRKRVGLEEGA